jgi:alpha-glucosidase (family GH31 glycosyl hydrolase)
MRHSRGTAGEVHNLYAQYWAAQLAEQHDRLNPDRRFFNLMRSGYAGMQRYYTFPWSGDVTRSWDAYRAQVPIMLGIGLCGVGYMHSDLGGFTGGPKDEELYQRWLQFGAFTPLMRVHGDAEGIAPEPIFYEPRTQEIVKKAIRQRYQLLPYTYTLAWENATQGLPLARPMFMHFPQDTATYRLNEQYLWGKDLLVAPVLEKGAQRKTIYFPAGVWYNFYSGEREAVGGWANVALSPERIPVYVRAGAFVPMASDLVNTRAFRGEKLEIHHFLDPAKQPQQGQWYLDDGERAAAIAAEAYQLTRVASAWKKKQWTLQWQAEGQGFAGQPANQTLTWVVHGLAEAPKKLQFQGKKLDLVDLNPGATPPPMTAWYDAGTQTLRFTVSWTGEPAEARLKVR